MLKRKGSTQLQIMGLGVVLDETLVNKLNDPDGWFNIFYQEVVSRVDESIFSPIYSDRGAPSIDVSVAIGFLALKEGLGLSFEHMSSSLICDFSFRCALGLFDFSVAPPDRRSIFNFLKRCREYKQETGVDLIYESFKQITSGQIREYRLSGKTIRMDSKLLGTNIASMGRLRIVQETLRKEYEKLQDLKIEIQEDLKEEIEELLKKEAEKYVYENTSSAVMERMRVIGKLMNRLIKECKLDEEQDNLLVRVFREQYQIKATENKVEIKEEGTGENLKAEAETDVQTEEKAEKKKNIKSEQEDEKTEAAEEIKMKPSKEISATSVQNPHDPEATYRKKEKQEVKGISVNITETVSEIEEGTEDSKSRDIAIIVGCDVENASTADSTYLEPGIADAEETTGEKVETVHADGAYNSPENREICEEKNIDLVTGGVCGKQSNYSYTVNEETNVLTVTDGTTGTKYECPLLRRESNGDRVWRFEEEKEGKKIYHYVKEKNLRIQAEREKQSGYSKETLNKRNNVEATMYLISKNTRNNKTRYRGLNRNKVGITGAVIWINFVRIRNNIKILRKRAA